MNPNVRAHQQHRASLRARRLLGEAGASIVEYGLVVALLVVGGLGAIQAFSSASKGAVEYEMDCISDRPPPPSCQPPPVEIPPDGGSGGDGGSDGGGGGDDGDDPGVPCGPVPELCEEPDPVPAEATLVDQGAEAQDEGWSAWVVIRVVDSEEGQPVAGAAVAGRATLGLPSLPFEFEVSCTTDVVGECRLQLWTGPGQSDSVRFDVELVTAEPPIDVPAPPPSAVVSRP